MIAMVTDGGYSRRDFLQGTASVSGTIYFPTHLSQTDTDLALDLPATVNGRTVIISGRLTDAMTNTGLSDQPIVLFDKDSGFGGNDDPIPGGGVNPLDTAPNRLTKTTTDQTGEFTLQWEASQRGNSADVEVYAKFPGTEKFASSRAPSSEYYPIRVTPNVLPYDYRVNEFMPFRVVVNGQISQIYLLMHTKNDFFADPEPTVPPIALDVEELSSNAYSLNPDTDQPYTVFPAQNVRTPGFLSTLEINSVALENTWQAYRVKAESVTIQRATNTTAFEVVPFSIEGIRQYTYDKLAHLIRPWWWADSGTVSALSGGTSDPAKYTVDVLTGVITTLIQGGPTPRNITKVAFQQLKKVFVDTVVPALKGITQKTVMAILDTAAKQAKVNAGTVSATLQRIPQCLQAGNKADAKSHLTTTLDQLETWRSQLETTNFDAAAPKQVALGTLHGTIQFLKAENKRLRDASQTPSPDWTMYRGQASRTGRASNATSPTPPFTEKWRFTTATQPLTTPAIVGDTVYTGSNDTNLYAINAESGETRWQFTKPTGNLTASVVVGCNTVYVGAGAGDSNVYAVDATTGNERWRFEQATQGITGLALAFGSLYVTSSDNTIYTINAATGEPRWYFEGMTSPPTHPAVVGESMYVGTWDGTVYALDAAIGANQWEFTIPLDTTHVAVGTDGVVYVGSRGGNIYAIEPDSGNPHWDQPFYVGSEVTSSPAVSDSAIYVTAGESLYALDAATGEKSWKFNPSDILLPPAVTAEWVHVAAVNGTIYTLEKSTGEKRKESSIPSKAENTLILDSGIIVGNEMLYAGTLDGNVVALESAKTDTETKNDQDTSKELTVKTGNASPKTETPRYVSFTGRIQGVPSDATVKAGFEYADYNGMWRQTEMEDITSQGTTEYTITEKMPYIGRTFPYRAFARIEDQSIERKGDTRKVSVPNFIDTVKIETVDAMVSGTSVTVKGRVTDFGKATTVHANAAISKTGFDADKPGIQSSTLKSNPPKLSADGSGEFSLSFDDLDSGTDYFARTKATIPAGPTNAETYGNVVKFQTSGQDRSSNFRPDIVDTNTPIQAGEVLKVTATIENTGSAEDTQEITLKYTHNPGTVDAKVRKVDSMTITLGPGETKTVTLNYETPKVSNRLKVPIYVESEDMGTGVEVIINAA